MILRNNKCFLDQDNIVEFSSSGQNAAEEEGSISNYAHLTNRMIFNILSSRLISSNISFGACLNSSNTNDTEDSDIICSLELKSPSHQIESMQFKISLETLTNMLINNKRNFTITSDKIEELILISKSLDILANKIQSFINDNSSRINHEIERDTPAW